MAHGLGHWAGAVIGIIFAAAGVPFAVYAVAMLRRGSQSQDAPFWVFAVLAIIALSIAAALWVGAAVLLKIVWGGTGRHGND